MIKRAGLAIVAMLAIMFFVQEVQAEEETAAGPNVQYVDLKPSFVANFGGPSKKLKFAKIDVSVRVNSVADGNTVESHFPLLRNEFVLLISQQSAEAISSMEGQEKLRLDALKSFRKVLKEEVGQPLVEDLLFTNFVLQQ